MISTHFSRFSPRMIEDTVRLNPDTKCRFAHLQGRKCANDCRWISMRFPTIMNGVEFRVTRYVMWHIRAWLICCNCYCSPFAAQRSRVTPDKRKWKSKGKKVSYEFVHTGRNKKTKERFSVHSSGRRETKREGKMEEGHSNCTVKRNRGSRFNCMY